MEWPLRRANCSGRRNHQCLSRNVRGIHPHGERLARSLTLDCQTSRNEIITRFQLVAQVAQSVEQRTENPRVGGSIPSLGTLMVEMKQRPCCGAGSAGSWGGSQRCPRIDARK